MIRSYGMTAKRKPKLSIQTEVLSVTFILSTVCHDNQELLRQNPRYLADLKALSLVDRAAQLEMGLREVTGRSNLRLKVFNGIGSRSCGGVPEEEDR